MMSLSRLPAQAASTAAAAVRRLARGVGASVALLAVLTRMKRDDVTTHGFRSAFRDWASERTTYGPEVAEMALAHAVGDKVEAAYRRGNLFEKRRGLMDDWAIFATKPASAEPGKVVSIVSHDNSDSADANADRVVRM